MLKNEYLVAKFGVDTAENEPRKEYVSRPESILGAKFDIEP